MPLTPLSEPVAAESRPRPELFREPYLTRQLIAYIGNKRTLLPFLRDMFVSLVPDTGRAAFLDPFAGSGSVSRLARCLGFSVSANDWEFYSWVLNSCYLTINRNETAEMFRADGGIECIFDSLNADTSVPAEPYFARHYAPASTEKADYRSERLFYSRENALFLDRVRSGIEERYSGWDLEERCMKEKLILLSSLLYEGSTHANTSGVFKACHKGFGGHGKDALSRILAPMHLEPPVLVDREQASRVSRMDARTFCSRNIADICYLDPPYTVHQYGSNYFMLNTLALWDRPPVSSDRTPEGRFREKAGIRKDWKTTRSAFCYGKTAPAAFMDLFDAIDARFILLSYNTEGLVPIETLIEMLSGRGEVRIYSHDYTKYRGGKQSMNRIVHNMELLLVTDTSARTGRRNAGDTERVLLTREVNALLRRNFNPERAVSVFHPDTEGRLHFRGETSPDTPGVPPVLVLETDHFYTVLSVVGDLARLSIQDLRLLKDRLTLCLCRDRSEECMVLMGLLDGELPVRERRQLWKRLLVIFKKFAFRKYRVEFENIRARIYSRIDEAPENFGGLSEGLKAVDRIAELRFNG